jgi:predicted transcriptional regulator
MARSVAFRWWYGLRDMGRILAGSGGTVLHLQVESAVYLLRREANLSLEEVAGLAGVSCSRVSQIQRELDLAPDDKRLRRIRRAIK